MVRCTPISVVEEVRIAPAPDWGVRRDIPMLLHVIDIDFPPNDDIDVDDDVDVRQRV